LQGWKGNAFVHGSNRKGVSEHMRAHRAVDAGFVRNALEDALSGAGRGVSPIVLPGVVKLLTLLPDP